MEHWTAAGFSAKAKSTHRDQKTARQAIPKDVSFWLIKRFSSLSSVCYLAAMKAILVAVMLLACAVIAEAQDGIISSVAIEGTNHCRLRFPAIREDTLFSSGPQLKNPKDGDLIDFYGPCDYDPLGIEEIRRQRANLRRKRNA